MLKKIHDYLKKYMIVFPIFLMKAHVLVQKAHLILLLFIPSIAFYVVTLALVTWLNKLLGFGYEDHMGMVYASTGKNEGTAIAIATSAFSPLVAVPPAMMPIFQIVFLVGYLKMEPIIRRYFGAKTREEAAPRQWRQRKRENVVVLAAKPPKQQHNFFFFSLQRRLSAPEDEERRRTPPSGVRGSGKGAKMAGFYALTPGPSPSGRGETSSGRSLGACLTRASPWKAKRGSPWRNATTCAPRRASWWTG